MGKSRTWLFPYGPARLLSNLPRRPLRHLCQGYPLYAKPLPPDANGLLPALRPLMEQIFNNLDSLKKSSASVIREEQLSPDSPDLMQRLQKDDAIAQRVAEVKNLVGKINSYGCLCKGVEQGLVDFPCQLGEEIGVLGELK